MNENDFAMDALNRLRSETRDTTTRLGNQIADRIMDIWISDPNFKTEILPTFAECPAFLYADVFDAMAKRMTERCQTEGMWYKMDNK